MASLFVNAHFGLGDHIIANGMIHYFAEKYDKVYVPHLKMYNKSLTSLYQNYEKIEPIEFPDIDLNLYGKHLLQEFINKTNSEYLMVGDPYLQYTPIHFLTSNGFYTKNVCINFERQMYEVAGLHYFYRYNYTKIPKSTTKSLELLKDLSKNKPYRLVQSSGSGGEYSLDFSNSNNNLHTIKIEPGYTENVFDFYDLIINAEEIHTIGSFFQPYVDSLHNETSAKLFYHSILAKHMSNINSILNNYRWDIIDYRYKL